MKNALLLLTKYVVGAKANPPRNPRREPKNGMAMAKIVVNAANERNKSKIQAVEE